MDAFLKGASRDVGRLRPRKSASKVSRARIGTSLPGRATASSSAARRWSCSAPESIEGCTEREEAKFSRAPTLKAFSELKAAHDRSKTRDHCALRGSRDSCLEWERLAIRKNRLRRRPVRVLNLTRHMMRWWRRVFETVHSAEKHRSGRGW